MAEEIRAEMVANVWKVVAKVDAKVEEGGTLVILESMKMEIPVLTESGGTVTKIAVKEGDVIQEGDLIAVVDDAKVDDAKPAAKGSGVAKPAADKPAAAKSPVADKPAPGRPAPAV